MFRNYRNKKSGFTLIETFVAISILMIAVLGPMGLLSKALADNSKLKNEMIANLLAREGLELTLAGLYNGDIAISGDDVCYYPSFENIKNLNSENCNSSKKIKYNSGANLITGYGYDNYSSDSIFTRKVRIIKTTNYIYKVTSTVSAVGMSRPMEVSGYYYVVK